MMWNVAMLKAKAVVSTPPPMTICASSARRWWDLSEAGRCVEERISWKIVFLASLECRTSPRRVLPMRAHWSFSRKKLETEWLVHMLIGWLGE